MSANLIPIQLDLTTGNIVASAISGGGGGGGSGTITSISAVGSTGLVITGSPITSNGTLTFTLSTELQALSGLSTTGFVQRAGVGTYVVANLTSAQVATALAYTPQVGPLSGDITTTSASSGVTTLATVNSNTGTFGSSTTIPSLNVNAKGLITAIANATIAFPVTSVSGSGAGITVTPTTGDVVIQNTGVLSFNGRTGVVGLLSADITNALGYTPAAGSVTNVAVTANNGISATVTNPSSNAVITLGLGAITPASVNTSGTITSSNFSGSSSGTNTGDQTIVLTGDVIGSGTGSFSTSLSTTGVTAGTYTYATVTVDAKGRVTTASSGITGGGGTVTSVGITTSDMTVTSSPVTTSGNIGLTLNTVNSNIGSFGSASAIPVITVNAKGLITAASAVSATYPVTSVFGRTGVITLLSSDVLAAVPNVGSFSNNVGYLTGVTFSSTNLTVTGSGTGTLTVNLPTTAVTAGSYTNTNITVDTLGRITAASNGSGASLPITTKGDLVGYNTAPARIPVGLSGQILTADSTNALGVSWQTVATGSGTVTSVGATSTGGDIAIVASNGNPITTFGTFDYELTTQGGLTAGSGYNHFTVNSKGIVTAANTVAYLTTAPVASVFGRTGVVVAATNDYSFSQISGSATAAQLPALIATGDATGTGTSGTATIPLTLANVNSNVGTFGSSTTVPIVTVNAKGLITAVTTSTISSPVTSVFGRTGVVTANTGDYTSAQVGLGNVTNNAQVRLSTVTTAGDLIVGTGTSTVTRLGIGSPGQVLTVSAGTAAWTSPSSAANVVQQIAASFAFGSPSPVTFVSTVPANAVIDNVKLIVDTAFDGTPTASVGISGNTAKYMATTDSNLNTGGVYQTVPGMIADGAIETIIITYVAGSSTVGAARVIITFCTPS